MISEAMHHLFSFNRYEVTQMAMRAGFGALPPIPIFTALTHILCEAHPQLAYNDDVNDPEGEDFIVTESQENRSAIAEIYLNRKVSIVGGSAEEQAAIHSNIKNQIIETWGRRLEKIQTISHNFGVTDVKLCVSIPKEHPEVSDPYAAVGSRFSPMSAPVIVKSCTPLTINIDPSHRPTPQDQNQQIEKMDEFILTHEIVHITKGDGLVRTIAQTAFAAFSTGVWVLAWTGGLTLTSSVTIVLGVSFAHQILINTFSRYQEKQADLTALNHLKTNEGALKFLNTISTTPNDTQHPPIAERKRYIEQWSN